MDDAAIPFCMGDRNLSPTATAKSCIDAGHLVGRSERYDAYACAHCNIWLEPRCSDPECEFCADRPELPSQPPE